MDVVNIDGTHYYIVGGFDRVIGIVDVTCGSHEDTSAGVEVVVGNVDAAS